VSEPPPSAPPARGAYLRLVLLGAAVGIPAALVGAGFLGFVHELEGWLWKVLPGQAGTEPAYLVLGLPVAGAVIVVLARRLLPGDGGHRRFRDSPAGSLRYPTRPASPWRRSARWRSVPCSARRHR
jgi:hypothetical protein